MKSASLNFRLARIRVSLLCLVLGVTTLSAQADLRVASLHPVLSDLARQVGGSHVVVVELLKPGGDPHTFSPSTSDLRRMEACQLILASGKGIEPYLPKLKDSLKPGQQVFDVGRAVPSLTISEDNGLFVCCPHHSVGSLDPHWWHSVKNMQRASKVLSKAFAKADPTNAKAYAAQAKRYESHLKALYGWARKEIARIPRANRKLATAHAAFTYFCKEFGFQSMPIQGLGKDREASSQYLADVIGDLKHHRVAAVFPEAQANPKVLQEMVRSTGARLGGRLFADYTGDSKRSTYDRHVPPQCEYDCTRARSRSLTQPHIDAWISASERHRYSCRIGLRADPTRTHDRLHGRRDG